MRGRRSAALTTTIAAALALAACGGSAGHAQLPAHPAHLPVPTSAPRDPAPAPRRAAGKLITARRSPYGAILIDGRGRTLYAFTRDASPQSTCYGQCARAWPPVLTGGAPRRGGTLTAAVGTTRRRDGAWQVTYGGHPLYYYVGDVTAGAILCQNVEEFGGTWLVVSPRGRPVR